jgi:hypothetical protein
MPPPNTAVPTEIEFLVQGSAAEPYLVYFRRHDAKTIAAHCTCAAGKSGMACKHRVRILRGSVEGVVSANAADVATVATWLAGSDAEAALEKIAALEEEAERNRRELAAAKWSLAKCLLK